ncbi:uncharacterized protein LOC122264671 isoform X2 [Penaeus japonicus]|uniref:uncharacterized protein LOC122264671 isoform X2 n=1 Tax=Penaeus japonicus TaxID=27405 RepID=UPI001C70B50B|nr:uncharacterized protein LOC122264671 isoform X2 [Penaeus japonicus]
MVLKDKTQPKLCFDNPLYNTDGAARPSSELKNNPKAPPEGAVVEHRAVSALKSNSSHRSWSEDLRREMISDRGPGHRGSCRSTTTTPGTPDSDFEEHIIENIRNRDFWSRRSHNSPFVRMRVSALVGNAPARASTPFDFPAAEWPVAVAAVPSEAEEEEEVDPVTSEWTQEALRERELRENITWLRNNLTEVSKTEGGKFSLSLFLTTMKNKELLRRLFSLWDVAGDGVLLQEEWVDHLKCSSRYVRLAVKSTDRFP